MCDWALQYCFTCDKQTDGSSYCSESCRLAEYEKAASVTSSRAESPALSSPSGSLLSVDPTKVTGFFLTPAYDFSRLQAFSSGLEPAAKTLSPSNSHASLCSIKSTSSVGTDAAQVSPKVSKELRAYAQSFESVRLQRRRSY